MEKYRDASYPTAERVEDLLARMTLEEKAAQLCGDLPASFIVAGRPDLTLLCAKYPHGHGRFTQYSLVGLVDPLQIARITNEVQRYFVEETRLGIPVALQSENLCGYPAAGGTLFPAMINLGCTFEPKLAERMAHVIGQESRAVGITSAMSPVIDVSCDPRWGRTYETFGEDPYVVSQFGIHYVRGMQAEGVSCIAKHFLGYAATQGGLNTAQARINDRELYETYATPFEAAAKEARLGGMMANYGEIDGLPVVVNPKIARTLLRDTMGFEGMLTSDGAAILKLFTYYRLARTYEEAGLLAKKAGTDTEIPVGAAFAKLPDYVRSGQLDESAIDESVRRVLTIKFDMGLFENPYVDEGAVSAAMGGPEKSALSAEIAEKSLVLLKNDGVLPLARGVKVAVVGPHADSLRYPVSGYTYPAYIEMFRAGTSGEETSFGGIADEQKKHEAEGEGGGAKGPFDALFDMFAKEDLSRLSDMQSVLRGMGARSLREALADFGEVAYAKGCDIMGSATDGFAEALAKAAEADVVVAALGGNCGWVNVTGGEGKDRQHLGLPGVQQQLLEALCAVGKPVVVVLFGPGVFAVNWADEHAAAIVEAFMPGQFAGAAVARALFGEVNPSGKLTMSVPRNTGQIPVTYNHKTGSGYRSGGDAAVAAIFSGGYVDGPADPLYHFGHGLSYTSFLIDGLRTDADEVTTTGMLQVCCDVSNTGSRPGEDVVMLFANFFGAHVTRPVLSLVGFKKLRLKPGERKTVRFDLSMSQLGYYDEEMEFVVEPGDLTLYASDTSKELACSKVVRIVGEKAGVLGRRSYTCPACVV